MSLSCPDWRSLCDRREAEQLEEAEWRRALAHLEECSVCADDAIAIEPTLLFRRLPTIEISSDEIATMRLAITGMSRAKTIERRRPAIRRPWLSAAALAALLLGSLLLRGAGPDQLEAGPGAELPALGDLWEPAAIEPEVDLGLQQMPLVEFIDPAYRPIVQVEDENFSVVVVAALNLDV